jgi:hypothetical protein
MADSKTPASPRTEAERLDELRTTFVRLNAAIRERLEELGRAEQDILDRVLNGHMSMNAQKVDGYKLADGMLARSMRLNVRINQRSLLYFNIRRRQLRRTLASLGADAEALEREWHATQAPTDEVSHPSGAPARDSAPESPTEAQPEVTEDATQDSAQDSAHTPPPSAA